MLSHYQWMTSVSYAKNALSKIAKNIWISKERCPITKELKKELILIEAIIKNTKII